ncbi:MAG: hypothetical protein QOE09_3493 [Ilumatobacteraceae bacterium]|jgi:hypothetical protein
MASTDAERSIKEERKESVKKAFEPQNQGPGADISAVSEPARGTEHVGESTSRRGEDVSKAEQESGRYDTGTDGSQGNRPTGESTPRDKTGVNPDKK